MKTLSVVFCAALLATLASAAPEGQRVDAVAPKAGEDEHPIVPKEKSVADVSVKTEEEGIVSAEEHESKRVKRSGISALYSVIGGAKDTKFVAIPITHVVGTIKHKTQTAKHALSAITLPLIGTKIAVPSFALPIISAKHSLVSHVIGTKAAALGALPVAASTVVGTKVAALAALPAAVKLAVASKLASPLAPVAIPIAAKAALAGKIHHFKTKAVGAIAHHKISTVTGHFS